ncbi:MAG: hypothetical protein KKA22_12400 [Gammaproteobacteria bacterium]|jgi:hypothetical protein|nr:hypothetical protein [Gammaproteobacteria bacterium]MBU1408939.1 hypothetical protein [Gammaproteobacteria bacterium]MBU1533640.1 hypothetical protein [Gammaproteobacteria bacterium]
MKNRLSALLIVAALAGLGGCETPPRYGEVRVHERDYDVRVVFSDRDRAIIRDYYRGYYRGLPPGLAKKGKIPPGHAFRMQRHQDLPPGVAWEYLPADVERRLNRLPDGYVRIVIGTDVAILHTRTRVVLDVIEDLRD